MRVYYVSGFANEVYYVRAEDEIEAEETLRKAIGKFLFKNNLRDDAEIVLPDKLGDNVIVEFGISKGTLDADLRFDDITAAAYIFAANDIPQWSDWTITTADIIGDKHVAESLEKTLFSLEKEEDDV